MLTRTYYRILAWLASQVGLSLFSPSAIEGLQERAYYDGWHDAEARFEALGQGYAK